jgi:hypothetical protein
MVDIVYNYSNHISYNNGLKHHHFTGGGGGLWCLTPLSTIFLLYRSLYWEIQGIVYILLVILSGIYKIMLNKRQKWYWFMMGIN